MASASKLEMVCRNLRGVLLSEKGGVAINRLQGDFQELTGTPVSFKEFGYPSLEGFLKSIPDVVSLRRGPDGGMLCTCVTDDTTQHIGSLVSRQKGKKKSKGSRMNTRPRRPPGSSYRPKPFYGNQFNPNRKPQPVTPKFRTKKPNPKSYKPQTQQQRFQMPKPAAKIDLKLTYRSSAAPPKPAKENPVEVRYYQSTTRTVSNNVLESASVSKSSASKSETAQQQRTPGPWSGKLGSKRGQQSANSTHPPKPQVSQTSTVNQPKVYENIYITVENNSVGKGKAKSKKQEWSSNYDVPPRFKKLMSPSGTTKPDSQHAGPSKTPEPLINTNPSQVTSKAASVSGTTWFWVQKILKEKANGIWASALSDMYKKEFGSSLDSSIIDQMAERNLLQKETVLNNTIVYPKKESPASKSYPECNITPPLSKLTPQASLHDPQDAALADPSTASILQATCQRQNSQLSYQTELRRKPQDEGNSQQNFHLAPLADAPLRISDLSQVERLEARAARFGLKGKAMVAEVDCQKPTPLMNLNFSSDRAEKFCILNSKMSPQPQETKAAQVLNDEGRSKMISLTGDKVKGLSQEELLKRRAERFGLTLQDYAYPEGVELDVQTGNAGKSATALRKASDLEIRRVLRETFGKTAIYETILNKDPVVSVCFIAGSVIGIGKGPTKSEARKAALRELLLNDRQLKKKQKAKSQEHLNLEDYQDQESERHFFSNVTSTGSSNGVLKPTNNTRWKPSDDWENRISGVTTTANLAGGDASSDSQTTVAPSDLSKPRTDSPGGQLQGNPTLDNASLPVWENRTSGVATTANLAGGDASSDSQTTVAPSDLSKPRTDSPGGQLQSNPTLDNASLPVDPSLMNSEGLDSAEDEGIASNINEITNGLASAQLGGTQSPPEPTEDTPSEPSDGGGSPTMDVPGVPNLQLPEEDKWEVYVSYIKSLSDFFVILIGDDYSEQLLDLEEEMRLFYQCSTWALTEAPEEGDCCAAQFNREWLRVEVRSVQGEQVECLLLDHGDIETVNINFLKPLSDTFLQLPFQVVRCKLAGSHQVAADDQKALQMFCQLALGKNLQAEITSRDGDLIVMELFDESDISILEQCMAAGI